MASHYRCGFVSTTCRADVARVAKAPISPKLGRLIQPMWVFATRGYAVGASKAANALQSNELCFGYPRHSARRDFTPEERKLILIMARKAEPHVYWVNWVCSFLGTRTSEVADANTLDIERIDGIWVMSIHRKHRSRDQRLKTKVSTRKLALHGALLDEGFLDYWRSLPAGGPLFPNVPLDTYGKRASKVTTECSIWLRPRANAAGSSGVRGGAPLCPRR
jgi:hypothetical protein